MLSVSKEKPVKSNGLDLGLGNTRSLEEECELVQSICERNPEAVVPLLMETLKQKHHAREKLEQLGEKLNASQWRPGLFLRRMAAFTDRALVAVGGQRLSVAIAPDVDPDELETGAAVFLDAGANLLVSLAPEIPPVGSIGVYSRPHGDRAVLVGPGDEEIVVELGSNLRGAVFSAGDLLVFDRDVLVAVDVVDSRHQHASILRTLKADKSIEELGGLDDVFDDILSEIELHLVHPEIVSRHQLKPVKGILLTGPPGVGKTSLIKCLARKLNELSNINAKVLAAPPSIHRAKWYGESEERIRAMFAEARQAVESEGTYALLVFDDVDHLGSRDGVHGIDSRILPSFLHEIDELRAVDRILLVGSTNRPDLLDRALLRPGRFGDRQYEIPRPSSRQATADILGRYLGDDLPYRPYRNGENEPQSMIDRATSALYAPNGELATLATIHFRSGSTRAVTPEMLMSGALVEAAVQDAKRRSCHRVVRQGPAGIGADDLLAAFDVQLTAVVDRLRPETARQLLDLPHDLDVVKVERTPRKTTPRRYAFTRKE